MSFDWADTVVVITGAASGIGAEVARVLMKEKVRHITILDINEEGGIALQNELNEKYGPDKVKLILCDVTNEDQLTKALKSVVDDHGSIDVMINNAGMMNDRVYRKEIELNVTAVITGTIKALELMRKDKTGNGGAIINVASLGGLYRVLEMCVYCATKAAVIHFTNCLGDKQFYSKTGVRLFSICFGATKTPLLLPEQMDSFDDEFVKGLNNIGSGSAYVMQSVESAALELVEAYKRADTGSVWIGKNDEPVIDASEDIEKSYSLFLPYVTKVE